jgi:hypothetical protein
VCEDAIDVSSVRCWVRCFKSSEKDAGDRPRSGRPATAARTETKDKVNALIWDGHHITTSERCTQTLENWWLSPSLKNLVMEKSVQDGC